MTKKLAKKYKAQGYEFAPVDAETSERIKKIAEATDSLPSEVINSAIQVLEAGMGREIHVEDDNQYTMKIDLYKKFRKLISFNQ